MGVVVNLRPAPVIPLHSKREGVKTYWHCAGDLFFNAGGRGVWLSVEDAFARRALFARGAGLAEPGSPEFCRAGALFIELTRALDDLDAHNRAVGKPSPYADPKAEARARFQICPEARP